MRGGKEIKAGDIGIVGRLFSVNMKMIDAYMGTIAICAIVLADFAKVRTYPNSG